MDDDSGMDGAVCAACGSANEPGRKFCGECGSPLSLACPNCGTANAAAVKFCGECGQRLAEEAARRATPVQPEAPAAERRLVSVLFVDLVGFTAASEGRDAEETRELLTRYFELARTTIERYGGTVEKFIGDAVMAVWGTPIAREDDAERAVRAGLELVGAIPELHPALQARAGVLTGEAAVTLAAKGQGMVAGDLVNTASRIQSAAEAGTVLVGEATKRAAEAAIVFEDAGEQDLKGKVEAVRVWRARQVVSARRGERRSAGLEPPFVGRDRELRLLKELFHATADERRAHLLSVLGIAGIGKSRLVWEFEKYVDGIAMRAWWHKGRCLSYGDGVAYWALAEMLRMRARVTEDEPPESALGKLHAVVEEIVADDDERAFVTPRLEHLLGLTERVAPDREDLFSAWRLFIERMADESPVIMVFEDIQWADAALLEFLEYLLDWSRSHPIYIVTLARPEIAERHPGWGANLRNFTSLTLDPLSDDAIDALLRGLVPGLSDDVVARIRDRADGVPLYAVETVRMLLNRGLVEHSEAGYRVTGDLEALDVPETLQALIAARLDALEPDERRLLQDAAVLGKTFAAKGLAALTGTDEEAVRPALASLVRKELLVVDNDPRSPERGQYGFLQALVQRVAYETLARRDRKARHLATASYLSAESGLDTDEIAEVIAAHLLDAYRAEPEAGDAAEIKREAREWLRRAGERAASLAATDDAQRAFEAAAELADEPLERAHLLERAGDLARAANRLETAERHLREAFAIWEQAGATHDRARVAAALGVAVARSGGIDEALALLEEAFAVLVDDEPDADVATLAAELGRWHFLAGNRERAAERIETALDIAEELRLPAVVSSALNTKALIVSRHSYEAEALMRQALRVALDNDLAPEALRAYNNMLVQADAADRVEEVEPLLAEGLALARRRGDKFWELRLAAGLFEEYKLAGRWDEAVELAETLLVDGASTDPILVGLSVGLARIALDRDDRTTAKRLLAGLPTDIDSADRQLRGGARWARAVTAELDGRTDDAAALIVEALEVAVELLNPGTVGETLREAANYAGLMHDRSSARTALAVADRLPANVRTRIFNSQFHRLRALIAAGDGLDADAADAHAIALANARNLGFPFLLAPVLYDYGAWLVESGREEAAPLLTEARELFVQMGAHAWLRRLEAIAPAAVAAA